MILRLLWICRSIWGENWHLKKTSILPIHKQDISIYLSLLWCLSLSLCSFLVYSFSKQVLDLLLCTSFLMFNVNSTALKFLDCIVHCKYIEIQLLSVHWYHTYPVILSSSSIRSRNFFADSLVLYIDNHVVYKEILFLTFLNYMSFISFHAFFHWLRLPVPQWVKVEGWDWTSLLSFQSKEERTYSFIIKCDVSYRFFAHALYQIKEVLFLVLLRVFIMNGCWFCPIDFLNLLKLYIIW